MSEGASLLDGIQRLIDSGGLELPIFNETTIRLQYLAESEDYDLNEVERLILSDQALAADVLRAANSPFFGGLSPIQTIRSAVVRLSLPQVSRLVLMASQRSKYVARDPEIRGLLHSLWRHAALTSMAAHWLAHRLSFRSLEQEAFLGGLLHDVGHLVILRAIDELKLPQNARFDFSSDLVKEILSSTHTTLGCNLLKRWNIPDVYCRIAREHHQQEFDPTDITLLLVRLANQATSKIGCSLAPDPTLILGALPEAQCLGAGEILLAELEIMLEDQVE